YHRPHPSLPAKPLLNLHHLQGGGGGVPPKPRTSPTGPSTGPLQRNVMMPLRGSSPLSGGPVVLVGKSQVGKKAAAEEDGDLSDIAEERESDFEDSESENAGAGGSLNQLGHAK
ncbi:hypothetical protein HK101_007571, partial [Irineochytrium annulatum]